jgi:8-amino-7-oxononanoate synthase
MKASPKPLRPEPCAWIAEELQRLEQQDLRRSLRVCSGVGGRVPGADGEVLNFSSNDYLDLARNPRVVAAATRAAERWGAGSGASRLVSGTLPIHEELEGALAGLKGYAAALVFGSGYATNVGILQALCGPGDHVFLDRLSHASLVDGALLSRARVHRFQHNEPADLARLLAKAPAAGRRLVATESVFSMDGDVAPLADLAAVAAEHGALLLVDEAHATGVFGPGGAGCIRAAGLEPRVALSMGTLSKALGSFGGFVACAAPVREWLVQRARSFIYSTALPPASAGAALGALEVLRGQPGLGTALLERAAAFRARLQAQGLDTGASQSQIVPVVVGDNGRTVRLAARLREQGLWTVAIRPPTVPAGTARVRLSVTLAHSEADLDRAAELIVSAARAEGLP